VLAAMTKKERRRFRKQEKKARKKQGMTEVVGLCKTADWLASQRDKLKADRPKFVEDLPADMPDPEIRKELCNRRRQFRRQFQHAHNRYMGVVERIRHKIDEVHNKLALFLCKNYRVILIPTFQVSGKTECAWLCDCLRACVCVCVPVCLNSAPVLSTFSPIRRDDSTW